MAPLGAPGCVVLTPPMTRVPAVTGPSGTAVCPIFVPSLPVLVGGVFYTQVWLLDSLANALGVTFTNGIDIAVGGIP